MKIVGVISGVALSLILGITVPAYAQDEKHQDEAKPTQQEEKRKPEAKPEGQQKTATKPPQPEENAAQEQEKNSQKQARDTRPGEQKGQPKGGGRIPADRFQASFGRQHTFHISQGDSGNRRFQYGGYSFDFLGSWPSNWLYTQDLFIVDIDGVYYLCNPMYPGINVALSVTL